MKNKKKITKKKLKESKKDLSGEIKRKKETCKQTSYDSLQLVIHKINI